MIFLNILISTVICLYVFISVMAGLSMFEDLYENGYSTKKDFADASVFDFIMTFLVFLPTTLIVLTLYTIYRILIYKPLKRLDS